MLFSLLVNILILSGFSLGFKPPNVQITSTLEKETVFSDAAVVTNTETCTNIALEILSEEGSAADAAIAALLCEGITNPQSMGVGGGFMLTIYNAAAKSVEVLNARECAPNGATEDMFGPISEKDIASGGLSVAVPGELKGYWALHKKYGKMSWIDIFKPTIELCKKGVTVTPYTAKMIAKVKEEIMASPSIKELLTNPDTGELYKEGETMFRTQLGETLEKVSMQGPDILYNGNLTEGFVLDIKDNGGIITADDLKNYKVRFENPHERNIGDFTIYTTPLPGSGALLTLILEVMSKKLCNKDTLFWHRLVETWKFAFGIRSNLTGPINGEKAKDSHFHEFQKLILKKMKDHGVRNSTKDYFLKKGGEVVADHGTSHICVLAPNGDAVSVTSTINLSFGSLFVSETTGIILNNEMVDFSIPHHYDFNSHAMKHRSNLIAPKRQPLSSMVPTIVTTKDSGELRLIIGSSGGLKILTSASAVMVQHLFMGVSLEEAIAEKRVHHQLKPMVLEYEEGFNDDILEGLVKLGHKLQSVDFEAGVNATTPVMHSGVMGIGVVNGEIHAVGDFRRMGWGGGY